MPFIIIINTEGMSNKICLSLLGENYEALLKNIEEEELDSSCSRTKTFYMGEMPDPSKSIHKYKAVLVKIWQCYCRMSPVDPKSYLIGKRT